MVDIIAIKCLETSRAICVCSATLKECPACRAWRRAELCPIPRTLQAQSSPPTELIAQLEARLPVVEAQREKAWKTGDRTTALRLATDVRNIRQRLYRNRKKLHH